MKLTKYFIRRLAAFTVYPVTRAFSHNADHINLFSLLEKETSPSKKNVNQNDK